MARSKHYCGDCGFHFQVSIEEHAEEYHNGGLFRGVENGNWRDYKEITQQ